MGGVKTWQKEMELVIIGGGPAGMAAAVSAREQGIREILILERDKYLGGILNQCIHNGFGLHTFQEELTGPEYAERYEQKVKEHKIKYELETMVTDIQKMVPEANYSPVCVSAVNQTYGFFQIKTRAVVLAMGCRERPRGTLNIPGFRPAGIYSAGTAQRMVNIMGVMPGKRVVILGSGDIGLIMARRMTLEGAKVLAVAELMPYSGGLKRNIVQCLEDYEIPLHLSHTVVEIKGKKRVEGIVLAEVDENRTPVPGTEKEYDCDTLLLSCGLLPENELSKAAGVELQMLTGGPAVNDRLETSVSGVFACGNVLHVHDLVDYVSEEAAAAGRFAGEYILKTENMDVNRRQQSKDGCEEVTITPGNGVRYTVPCRISPNQMAEETIIRFRVDGVYRNRYTTVSFGDRCLLHTKRRMLTPGKMEQIILKRESLLTDEEELAVRISIEEA